MKKYLVLIVLTGLFLAVPVSAQTVSRTNQTIWQGLLGINSQIENEQQVAATVYGLKSTTVKATPETIDVVPESTQPQELSGGCIGPVGRGSLNWTVRCNGREWVGASNLLNDGTNVGIGVVPETYVKLHAVSNYVKSTIAGTNTGDGTGVVGTSVGYIGVVGSGPTGVWGDSPNNTHEGVGVRGDGAYGVYGNGLGSSGVGVIGIATGGFPSNIGILGVADNEGIAVKASKADNASGYGFYQSGLNAKNYFEGNFGIGIDVPTNIKLLVDSSLSKTIEGKNTINGGVGVSGTARNSDLNSGSPLDGGTGVSGSGHIGVQGASTHSLSSIGVLGTIGGPSAPVSSYPAIAVKASVDSDGENTYGFYQSGGQAVKNGFEGSLFLGGYTLGSPAKLQVHGGVQIAPVTLPQPACQSNARGTFWFVQGASGAADSAQVCAKNADNTYSWKNLF